MYQEWLICRKVKGKEVPAETFVGTYDMLLNRLDKLHKLYEMEFVVYPKNYEM